MMEEGFPRDGAGRRPGQAGGEEAGEEARLPLASSQSVVGRHPRIHASLLSLASPPSRCLASRVNTWMAGGTGTDAFKVSPLFRHDERPKMGGEVQVPKGASRKIRVHVAWGCKLGAEVLRGCGPSRRDREVQGPRMDQKM
ncbi:unnamed protein product [Darwinula stevensoni]|uniref:Uncharacterized protein n=1 Tax=Darwinula stevensoni TaxID=69355 RepID=A0A7R9A4D1_9CRUS|nr:unnamed protein product [Darwinula stevensoni]CAG0883127.1 unnamed protein product [Darwinula stevensoni]